MNATARKLHFTVDGEGLTSILRDRVLEDRWDWSYHLLINDLEGMTHEIAIAILKGDKKLVTAGAGVDLADDDDQDYKHAFQQKFAGVYVTSQGRFLRPYAVVTSWGPEDYRDEDTSSTPGSDACRSKLRPDKGRDFAYRSLYYARDRKRDVLKVVRLPADYVLEMEVSPTSEHTVLFQDITNYPSLLAGQAPLEDAQSAVEAYLAAGRYLEEVGYSQTFPADPSTIRQVTAEDEQPTLARTMAGLQKASDVDVLLDFQRSEIEIGREAAAEQVAKVLNDAAAVASDPTYALDARLIAYRSHEAAKTLAQESIREYAKLIREQAGDDLFDLKVEGKVYRVPRAPFENWALNHTSWWHLAPAWETISPSGLKMFGDDPYHTDWMLGAGLDLADWNHRGEEALTRIAYQASHEVQERYFQAKVPVLSGRGATFGRIIHLGPNERSGGRGEIAVIKNAGPDYVYAAEEAIKNGGALICEAGGAVAHLVTVFRDQDLKIVRVPDASKLYPVGRFVTVDCDKGEVRLSDQGPIRLSNGMVIGEDE